MPETRKPANRLIDEPSPYLQQHAHNPVDWYPWGDEAFERARAGDRPVFLSIGYSTCHWCHVMERESFEDDEVARLLNRHFVSVKVDREERPDVDQTYMTVCLMLHGSGGWPLTIVTTPEGKPFFAATYIPRTALFGRPGLLELLPRIAQAWRERRAEVERYAAQVTGRLEASAAAEDGVSTGETLVGRPAVPGAGVPGAGAARAGRDLLDRAYAELQRSYDPVHGGFGFRPKFPTPHHLTFLLRYWRRSGKATALEMVEKTLRAMRRGGIYDHLGGGFHRYSTDERWLLPHFEKMLYDQAILVIAYAEAFQATGRPEYRTTAEEVISYVRRRLTAPGGGFYSAEDADSEGEEGRFYVWEEREIREVLGPGTAGRFVAAYGVRAGGNFADEATGRREGRNVLRLDPESDEPARGELAAARERLFQHREQRVHPFRDDKILTGWNGLMIAALGHAAQAFAQPAHAKLAAQAAGFLLREVGGGKGRLLHRHRGGRADIRGYLDDYAFLVWGLLELYEATFEPRWLEEAVRLSRAMVEQFEDRTRGGFFFTAGDAPKVLARTREFQDGAVPSGNSVAVLNLLRLARMTGDVSFEETASRAAVAAARHAERAPAAFTQLLGAIDFALGPSSEVVVVGEAGREDTVAMLCAVRQAFVPNKVVLFRPGGREGDRIADLAPYVRDLEAVGGRATAYVCRDFECGLPVTGAEEAAARLEAAGGERAAEPAAVPAPHGQLIARPSKE